MNTIIQTPTKRVVDDSKEILATINDIFVNNAVIEIGQDNQEWGLPGLIQCIDKNNNLFTLKIIQHANLTPFSANRPLQCATYLHGERVCFEANITTDSLTNKHAYYYLSIPNTLKIYFERRVFRAVLYHHKHPIFIRNKETGSLLDQAFIRDLSIHGAKLMASNKLIEQISQFEELLADFHIEDIPIQCPMQVRWINDKNSDNGFISLGCQFQNLESWQEQIIGNYVNQIQGDHLNSYESRISVSQYDIPVIISTHEDLECIGALQDLSIRGCKLKIISNELVVKDKSTSANCRIKLGIGKVIHCQARIKRVEVATQGQTQSVGLEFYGLTPESNKLIIAFMDQVFKETIKNGIRESLLSRRKKAG